jgi:hypothetical protein
MSDMTPHQRALVGERYAQDVVQAYQILHRFKTDLDSGVEQGVTIDFIEVSTAITMVLREMDWTSSALQRASSALDVEVRERVKVTRVLEGVLREQVGVGEWLRGGRE